MVLLKDPFFTTRTQRKDTILSCLPLDLSWWNLMFFCIHKSVKIKGNRKVNNEKKVTKNKTSFICVHDLSGAFYF